jgi:hypothetical protein
MTRFAAWLSRNADVAIALALAIIVALLAVIDAFDRTKPFQNYVSAAILIVLALLATTLLNTTDLSCSGSRNAATWCFVLVWRRRGTPDRR